jgi:hypothetical protein
MESIHPRFFLFVLLFLAVSCRAESTRDLNVGPCEMDFQGTRVLLSGELCAPTAKRDEHGDQLQITTADMQLGLTVMKPARFDSVWRMVSTFGHSISAKFAQDGGGYIDVLELDQGNVVCQHDEGIIVRRVYSVWEWHVYPSRVESWLFTVKCSHTIVQVYSVGAPVGKPMEGKSEFLRKLTWVRIEEPTSLDAPPTNKAP